MEKEFNQNTRTLIVSFIFALMVLVPLRFMEFKNNYSSQSVLGESVELVDDQAAVEDDVEIITSNDCFSDEYVDSSVSSLIGEAEMDGVSEIRTQKILDAITRFEASRCQ